MNIKTSLVAIEEKVIYENWIESSVHFLKYGILLEFG